MNKKNHSHQQALVQKAFIKFLVFYILAIFFSVIPPHDIYTSAFILIVLFIPCIIISVIYQIIILLKTRKTPRTKELSFYRDFAKMMLLSLLSGAMTLFIIDGLIKRVFGQYRFLNGDVTGYCVWIATTIIFGLIVIIKYRNKK